MVSPLRRIFQLVALARILPLLLPLAAAAQPPAPPAGAMEGDWLVAPGPYRASITESQGQITLQNGLIRRVIQIAPNAATVAFDNLMTGASMLRALEPEATLVVDGRRIEVGGLHGQPDRAYLRPEWFPKLTNAPGALQIRSFQIGTPVKPLEWKRTRHGRDLPWPPPGQAVDLRFTGDDTSTVGLGVTIHLEIYDGVPVVGKWMTVSNGTDRAIRIDRFESERLSIVEADSAVDERPNIAWVTPGIDVLSDYMFRGMDLVTGNHVGRWEPDPLFKSQVSYLLNTPCRLVVAPPVGPGVVVPAGGSFDTFRAYLVVHDSTERERKGLTLRRAQKTIAPWITENPLMMHVRSADRKTFRTAVDQCAEVGFEMIIYTFGSGMNMESSDAAYIAKVREDVEYAHSKGIQVGSYSLFSSRRIDDANDVINPATGKTGGAIFGNAPCFGSRWGEDYFRKLTNFITQTGFDLLEHDGPYPGDLCASTNHPGHSGVADSQWVNWRRSVELYSWCRARGVYINQPDYYFLAGGSKTGMGYREDNWSLPRAQQLIHARQNIFDGTWTKPQTAGWMFVPLTEYHGGGPAATLEPLHQHLPDYERHLANTLGSGVQACWRGPRLFDTPETRDLVKRWVTWFKRHREILESDIIHCRRADSRQLDYLLHVNPALETRALSMIHNPLDHPVTERIPLPLYYAGLSNKARIRIADGPRRVVRLDAKQRAWIEVTVPANSQTWVTAEAP